MVLTTMRYRGRGLARRLMTEALGLADRRKIEGVRLHATDQGRPLQEKLGFRANRLQILSGSKGRPYEGAPR